MRTTGLLVVDVQPAYSQWCEPVARQVAKRINNTRKPTVVMWVGEGVTSDTEDDVREYLRAHGARPGKLAYCDFVEKDYGFFRGWMDNGVADEDIIKVGTEMLRQGHYSSEDLDLPELFGDNLPDLPEWDNLMAPRLTTGVFLALRILRPAAAVRVSVWQRLNSGWP